MSVKASQVAHGAATPLLTPHTVTPSLLVRLSAQVGGPHLSHHHSLFLSLDWHEFILRASSLGVSNCFIFGMSFLCLARGT